jgi:hypothetical protein
MKLEDGKIIHSNTDFVNGGGFFAIAVLSIGIPFN